MDASNVPARRAPRGPSGAGAALSLALALSVSLSVAAAVAVAAAGAARAADGAVEGYAGLSGQPAPGVVVLAFAQAGPGPGEAPREVSAATAADGSYRMALPAGSYHLLAVKTAGKPWPFAGAPGDLYCYYLGSPVVVEPGKTARIGFNMVRVGERLEPVAAEGAGIEGRVLFEGKPLGRAYVQVYADAKANFRGMGLSAAPAGEDGRFRLRLAPGRYYVLARKRQAGGMYGPPGKDDYVGYYPGNPVEVRAGRMTRIDLETATRVDMLEGSRSGAGEGPGWFSGVVRDPAGKPLAGLYVLFYTSAERSGAPAFVAGPTDGRGAFKVRAAAGAFHLVARSRLGGPVEAGELYGTGETGGSGAEIKLTAAPHRGE